ncbi:MAG: DUF5319 family protein [Mycobacteriales bacterium]
MNNEGRPPHGHGAHGQGSDSGPLDPFLGDPDDPAAELGQEAPEPLRPEEELEVQGDLEDLDLFETVLGSRGIKGVVMECDDCEEPHYFTWDLMRSNLRYLLEAGQTRVHEPAYQPDIDDYVTWEYAHGYVDGVTGESPHP